MHISPKTITGFDLKQGAYQDILPEYYDLKKVTEHSLWHDHQNVFDHVVKVYEKLEAILTTGLLLSKNQHKALIVYLNQLVGIHTREELLRISTLIHDIAKAETLVISADGSARCPGHELLGSGMVKSFQERFSLSDEECTIVTEVVKCHGMASDVVGLVLAKGEVEKYIALFKASVGSVAIELIVLLLADNAGCDLDLTSPEEYKARQDILSKMLEFSLNGSV